MVVWRQLRAGRRSGCSHDVVRQSALKNDIEALIGRLNSSRRIADVPPVSSQARQAGHDGFSDTTTHELQRTGSPIPVYKKLV